MKKYIEIKKKKTVMGFLSSKEIKVRQCVYISREVQQKISRIVNVLSGGESTIGSYIDNVLLEHLNEHKDEINALYHQRIKDLL